MTLRHDIHAAVVVVGSPPLIAFGQADWLLLEHTDETCLGGACS